jgi:hypothetical protein
MACPFFLPDTPMEAELWPHRRRLPLGDGWRGQCATGVSPGEEQLREFCNLGYAKKCPHLPAQREADAVRFSVHSEGARVTVDYICEREHRPGRRGSLEFDQFRATWTVRHPDNCIQRQAECCLAAYLAQKKWRRAAR